LTGQGWASIHPDLRAIAERVCTVEQLDVLKLKAGGMGYRMIALSLGVTREAVRDRHRRAELNIAREVAARRNLPHSP
jgi:transcriptional regulator